MNINIKSNDSNKIFVNTLIYFWSIALIVAILESFENKDVINIFWHFVTNSVNFIVLATTIFLITLNNPIKKVNTQDSKIKQMFYKVFLVCNVIITTISPIVIINSDSLGFIKQLYINIVNHHEKYIFHFNLIEVILMVICIFVFSIPLISAKIYNTVDDSDDDLIENLAEQIENNVNVNTTKNEFN